jgi:hypothetical protein
MNPHANAFRSECSNCGEPFPPSETKAEVANAMTTVGIKTGAITVRIKPGAITVSIKTGVITVRIEAATTVMTVVTMTAADRRLTFDDPGVPNAPSRSPSLRCAAPAGRAHTQSGNALRNLQRGFFQCPWDNVLGDPEL